MIICSPPARQILHYKDGEKYEPHHDFFHDTVNARPENGGQRIATVLIYLCAAQFRSARLDIALMHLSSGVSLVPGTWEATGGQCTLATTDCPHAAIYHTAVAGGVSAIAHCPSARV